MINYGPFKSNRRRSFGIFGNSEGGFLKIATRQVSGPKSDTVAEAKHNVGQNPETYSNQSGHWLPLWSALLKSLLPER